MSESSSELVITDANFSQYFRDVRQSKPERGDIMARYTAMAEFVDGRLKRDLISVLKMQGKTIPAVNVMRKLGCAMQEESYRICKEITEDMMAGMTDDEIAAKPYKYQMEVFYYTKKEYVPENDPHWQLISINNLDEFMDMSGKKLKASWKIVDGDQFKDKIVEANA